jgi:hypothetical protein
MKEFGIGEFGKGYLGFGLVRFLGLALLVIFPEV